MTVEILIGDVREQLRKLPTAYFDCVVTSPPYWGLRDYGIEGQIGLERTLGEHLDVMVDVFREVRRVLKQQGTLWLNYGDCYAAAPNGKSAAAYKADGSDDRSFRDKPFSTVGAIYDRDSSIGGQRGDPKRKAVGEGVPGGRIVAVGNPRGSFASGDRQSRMESTVRVGAGGLLKPKDLCMIPNRLAIALQDDGWWVRSEIIWHKPNPMPESVYDRPTSAHEKVWLLTKGEEYFYNHEAIREPVSANTHARLSQDVASQRGSLRANGGTRADRPMKAVGRNSRQNVDRVPESRKVPAGWDTDPGHHGASNRAGRNSSRKLAEPGSGTKNNSSFDAAMAVMPDTRNARNVWTIAPKAFREAHFATFPPELAERCIKAGVPSTVCHLCGEARTPEDCGGICAGQARDPGRVLDPFGGAGTVGLVAQRMGLDCTLIELNPEYAAMARKRIDGPAKPDAVQPDASRETPEAPETTLSAP